MTSAVAVTMGGHDDPGESLAAFQRDGPLDGSRLRLLSARDGAQQEDPNYHHKESSHHLLSFLCFASKKVDPRRGESAPIGNEGKKFRLSY